MTTVIRQVSDEVMTLTLNRPDKLNCISWQVMEELDGALKEAADDQAVKVVVLRGAGERSFSTGGDLKEFPSLGREDTARWIRTGNLLFDRLEAMAKPTLAVIQGYAYGGGLELALCCDLRLATGQAQFSAPELQHGWIPGWGCLTRLPRLIGEAKAREMVLLGEVLDAEGALRLGLVNRIVEKDELDRALGEIVGRLRQIDPEVFAWAKAALLDPARPLSRSRVEFDVLASLASRRL